MLAGSALTALLALTPALQAASSDSSLLDRIRGAAGAVLGDEESRYYLQVGGITTGAGFGLGPGLRLKGLGGGHLDLNAVAVVSYRKYLLAETSLSVPNLGRRGLEVGVFARRKYFPQEDYFGVGDESRSEDRVNYAYDENAAGSFVTLAASRRLTFDARVAYRHPDIGRGHDDSQPSIESRFDDAAAPGLLYQPDFLVGSVSVEYEGAIPNGRPRRGGRYVASVSRFSGRGSHAYDFNRLDADLCQYVPLVADEHLLVFRAVTSLTGASGKREVPFYYLPTLGGGRSLRGFREFRFHDRNVLLLQGEYRWLPVRFVEAAVFYEAGTLAPRPSGLSLGRVLSDYGVGVRFGTDSRIFFRIESAFGSRDGTRVFFKWSAAF